MQCESSFNMQKDVEDECIEWQNPLSTLFMDDQTSIPDIAAKTVQSSFEVFLLLPELYSHFAAKTNISVFLIYHSD